MRQARKRKKESGIQPASCFYGPRQNRPGRDLIQHATTIARPHDDGTISRQALRHQLRLKARKDVMEQYGRIGYSGTLGYLGFSRRGRRNVMRNAAKRWYTQIREAAGSDPSFGRQRGFVKDVLRWMFGAKPNTLAASMGK